MLQLADYLSIRQGYSAQEQRAKDGRFGTVAGTLTGKLAPGDSKPSPSAPGIGQPVGSAVGAPVATTTVATIPDVTPKKATSKTAAPGHTAAMKASTTGRAASKPKQGLKQHVAKARLAARVKSAKIHVLKGKAQSSKHQIVKKGAGLRQPKTPHRIKAGRQFGKAILKSTHVHSKPGH